MFKNKQLLMYGNQLKYLEQVRKELELRKSRVASISYRKKLREAKEGLGQRENRD